MPNVIDSEGNIVNNDSSCHHITQQITGPEFSRNGITRCACCMCNVENGTDQKLFCTFTRPITPGSFFNSLYIDVALVPTRHVDGRYFWWPEGEPVLGTDNIFNLYDVLMRIADRKVAAERARREAERAELDRRLNGSFFTSAGTGTNWNTQDYYIPVSNSYVDGINEQTAMTQAGPWSACSSCPADNTTQAFRQESRGPMEWHDRNGDGMAPNTNSYRRFYQQNFGRSNWRNR